MFCVSPLFLRYVKPFVLVSGRDNQSLEKIGGKSNKHLGLNLTVVVKPRPSVLISSPIENRFLNLARIEDP